jgi:hypothetical protein
VLKESVIATEALGKSSDFDPRVDPAVRVVAGRLRKRLKEYYASDGRLDPVVIQFPSSGYVPSFRVRHEEEAPQPAAGRNRFPKWIAISAFALVGIALISGFAIWSKKTSRSGHGTVPSQSAKSTASGDQKKPTPTLKNDMITSQKSKSTGLKQNRPIDINGRWVAEMSSADPSDKELSTTVFEFTVVGSSVTGVVTYPCATEFIVDGTIIGRRLVFKVPNSPPITTLYRCEVREDGIHIVADDLFGRREGVAKRRSKP